MSKDNVLDTVLVDRAADGIVTLTLNRPNVKNAITPSMWEPLRQIFQEIRETESDRALVITGAGGEFCAGADLAWCQAGPGREVHRGLQGEAACGEGGAPGLSATVAPPDASHRPLLATAQERLHPDLVGLSKWP